MPKSNYKMEHICPLQMIKMCPNYRKTLRRLLFNHENSKNINLFIQKILNFIIKKENCSLLKKIEETREEKKTNRILLSFKQGHICLYSQTDYGNNNLVGLSVFSNRCSCSPTCNGILKYKCYINEIPNKDMEGTNYIIQENSMIIIELIGCENHLDYILKGKYDGEFKEDVKVEYKNGSTYIGKWKDGLPHGYGVLKLNGQTLGYDKICGLNINNIIIYGTHKEGILDETKTFKIFVILNKVTKKDKYCMILYENTTLLGKQFIPHKKGNISYYDSYDENPEKCYAVAKGKINSGRLVFGEINYLNPKSMIISYRGVFKDNKYSKGLSIFSKSHSILSFDGEYNNGEPTFGIIKYKDGRIYTGYVNSDYHNFGDGVMDETNIHDVECECCKTVVKKDTYCSKLEKLFFGRIEGFWMNDALCFSKPLTKECSKPHCRNIKKYACLICEEYLCEKCYIAHQTHTGSKKIYKYHNVMRLCSEEEMNDDLYLKGVHESTIPPKQKPKSKTITTIKKVGKLVLASIEPKVHTIPNETKPSRQKKKKKKHKKQTLLNTQKSFIETPQEFEITTEEKEELEKGIVNEKMINFMNDVTINGLKELGFTNTSSIRKEDITFSIETIISNPTNHTKTVLESNEQCIVIETPEEQREEELPKQPYYSLFDDYLKEMKKEYNSNLTRKTKR